MSDLTTRDANLPVPLMTMQRYGRLMLSTLDKVFESDEASPERISFSDWAAFGDRYVGFFVDTQRLYHLPIKKLTTDEVTQRLSWAVRKPVHAITDAALGLLYVVEVKSRQRVALPSDVVLDLGTRPTEPGIWLPIGVSASGPLWFSLSKLGHLLIGGSTGSGKSNYLQTLLLALTSYDPAQVRVMLIDPKVVEMAFHSGAPHLDAPIATDLESATRLVEDLIDEVDRRLNLLVSAGVRDMDGYNRIASEPLPRLVVVVDEFLDLALTGGPRSAFYTALVRNANKARAAGVTLILSATNPKAEVMNTSLRGACQTRLAFRVNEPAGSETILERRGAETISISTPGRMLARLPDVAGLVEVQAFRVTDEMLQGVAQHRNTGATPGATPLQHLPLADDERQVLRVVLQSGRFSVRSVYGVLQGSVSQRRVAEIGRNWAKYGWLGEPDADQMRPATQVLQQIAADDAAVLQV